MNTTTTKQSIYIIALLEIITLTAATNQPQKATIKKVSLNDLKVEITTTKTTYRVSEDITGTIWLVNDSPETLTLAPIFTANFTAGYTLNLKSSTVNFDYSSPETEIPSGGRFNFIPFHYTASKQGTYEIMSYGAKATVDVTENKYQTLTPHPTIPIAYSTDELYHTRIAAIGPLFPLHHQICGGGPISP
jgi:hypothetical protein